MGSVKAGGVKGTFPNFWILFLDFLDFVLDEGAQPSALPAFLSHFSVLAGLWIIEGVSLPLRGNR